MSPSLGVAEVLAHDNDGPKLEAISTKLEGQQWTRIVSEPMQVSRVMCSKPIDEVELE